MFCEDFEEVVRACGIMQPVSESPTMTPSASTTTTLSPITSSLPAHTYLNSLLTPSTSLTDASSLLSMLDTELRGKIAELGVLADEMVRVGRRVGWEVQEVERGVEEIGEQLESLEPKGKPMTGNGADGGAPETDGEGALERLRVLEVVHARLVATRDTLLSARETLPPPAPTPTPPPEHAITSELTFLLSSRDFPRAEKRVKELEDLVSVFDGTAEEDARKRWLSALRVQLLEAKAKEEETQREREGGGRGSRDSRERRSVEREQEGEGQGQGQGQGQHGGVRGAQGFLSGLKGRMGY
ncbi:hypothetical protein SAICODRAFT_204614 [Saitoella complicata NRRL Y-17804]|uniref:uncharacterized protein n=1 Tax=Saitoella complicata (strain BCRC 22490 / CBS 7301 / JCM 7358 / NBRC 10748 / NRRL Y-17804) TaxID=698492 RepID=UPI000866B8A4|nr:uncharacterized protein SAICODRAFT_204614 [Saitoella complicata NRRL Y-17804]ODQ54725.1 hypothetical protein SAICODRAFT_204614 [Saitoella complicata NRRL Y-17804]